MARACTARDLEPVLDAARAWVDACLIEDGSILGQGSIWTDRNIRALKEAFVDRPDEGDRDFLSKFKDQLRDVDGATRQLAAECIWVLLLFPSNIRAKTKREQILDLWSMSGQSLAPDNRFLSDRVLAGVGSGGQAFNTHRHRELTYLIGVATAIKALPKERRRDVLSDYSAFAKWLAGVPSEGNRQLRHMLRYFLFPDRVERIATNRDRRSIIVEFGEASASDVKKWSDEQLDDRLMTLRKRLEVEFPRQVLDFYEPPLKERWARDDAGHKARSAPGPATVEPPSDDRPVNLILYGPPGTGKTYWLQQQFAKYTDQPADVDEAKKGRKSSGDAVKRYRFVTFHPSFGYEDFVRGIRPVVAAAGGSAQFDVVDGVLKQVCDEARANPGRPYALFIDEINRANIAKVFGELITLLEPDKRVSVDENGRVRSGMTVQLPGDGPEDAPFGVPANLDVYGTMNTADRSIALLDVALRRRFEFKELEPDYALLDQTVDNVHLGRLLERINDRLEYLLDRDHRIGHAYFMSVTSLEDLRRVFSVQVIPLLQEFFFDDLSRVSAVIAVDPQLPPFVRMEPVSFMSLFAIDSPPGVPIERKRFTVTDSAGWTDEMFVSIYESSVAGREEDEDS